MDRRNCTPSPILRLGDTHYHRRASPDYAWRAFGNFVKSTSKRNIGEAHVTEGIECPLSLSPRATSRVPQQGRTRTNDNRLNEKDHHHSATRGSARMIHITTLSRDRVADDDDGGRGDSSGGFHLRFENDKGALSRLSPFTTASPRILGAVSFPKSFQKSYGTSCLKAKRKDRGLTKAKAEKASTHTGVRRVLVKSGAIFSPEIAVSARDCDRGPTESQQTPSTCAICR